MGWFSLSCPYSIQYSQDWKCNHLTLRDKSILLGKLRFLVSFLRGTRISRGVRALTALESGRADSDPQAPVSWPHSLPSCHQAAPSSHCPAICFHCLFRKNEFWNPHRAPLCGHTVPCNVLTLCLFTHLCLTLCDPVDCSLPGSSAHGILQARRLECCRALLQGIFPTQDQTRSSTLQAIPYHLHHQGIKKNLKSFYSILVDPVSLIHLFHCVLRPSSLIAAKIWLQQIKSLIDFISGFLYCCSLDIKFLH